MADLDENWIVMPDGGLCFPACLWCWDHESGRAFWLIDHGRTFHWLYRGTLSICIVRSNKANRLKFSVYSCLLGILEALPWWVLLNLQPPGLVHSCKLLSGSDVNVRCQLICFILLTLKKCKTNEAVCLERQNCPERGFIVNILHI